MGKQRMSDYLGLIERLLTYPTREEPVTWQGAMELLQAMGGVVEQLTAEMLESGTAFLNDLAEQLGLMPTGQAGYEVIPEEVVEFLIEVLSAEIEGGQTALPICT